MGAGLAQFKVGCDPRLRSNFYNLILRDVCSLNIDPRGLWDCICQLDPKESSYNYLLSTRNFKFSQQQAMAVLQT